MPEGHSDELWRRRARSFGSSAAEYAEHRPDYAADAVSWVLSGAARDVVDVLDLGAGTGAVTGTLRSLGRRVIAVDPDDLMLAELRRSDPEPRVLVGSAAAIPLADASVDAVLAGTSFHWFDRDRAVPEIARVLRAGGVLGTLYNIQDDSVPWVAELDTISRTSASSAPRQGDEQWPTPLLDDAFGSWEDGRFPHRQRRTAESLTATIGTHSHTKVVSADERQVTLARIRTFLDSRPETGRGEFELPLTTVARRVLRREAAGRGGPCR